LEPAPAPPGGRFSASPDEFAEPPAGAAATSVLDRVFADEWGAREEVLPVPPRPDGAAAAGDAGGAVEAAAIPETGVPAEVSVPAAAVRRPAWQALLAGLLAVGCVLRPRRRPKSGDE
jgi:hypothetical protein